MAKVSESGWCNNDLILRAARDAITKNASISYSGDVQQNSSLVSNIANRLFGDKSQGNNL